MAEKREGPSKTRFSAQTLQATQADDRRQKQWGKSYQALRSSSGSSSISSLLHSLYLGLQVQGGVKVTAGIPRTLSFYEIHTDGYMVVSGVDCYIFRGVCETTFTRLACAWAPLKFTTYLKIELWRIVMWAGSNAICLGGQAHTPGRGSIHTGHRVATAGRLEGKHSKVKVIHTVHSPTRSR